MARKKVEKAANHERWLLTYADMITLLMIFFIVLWSMSSADSEKFKKISAALSRAFSIDLFESSQAGAAAPAQSIQDGRQLAFIAIKSQIGQLAAANKVAADVNVRLDREGVVVTLSGNFVFESGRAELRPEAQPLLDGVVAYLRTIPNEVRIGGHTDNVPVETPLFASNWELSSARAIAIVKYLTTNGIAAERLGAVGYGEYRPLVPNDTRADRAKNRRAELLIVFPDANLPFAVTGGQPIPGLPARATTEVPAP